MNLSPEQQAVVDAWGRGVAVMAGAGAGKTTTLVQKCAELLRRKPDARFAAVSFTERSASDLKAKLAKKLPLSGHWVMTIHGLCAAILREFPREAGCDGGETMLSSGEAVLVWERALDSLWFDDLPEPIREAMQLLLERDSRDNVTSLLARVKELVAFGAIERLRQAEDPRSQALARLSAYVLERFERSKRRAGMLDFSDLEICAERALEDPEVRAAFRSRFDLVLVDEFQDTNPLQAKLIRAFCREDLSNLCVVGDPKQSIYRFRDADVSLFEEFCASLPERHSLTWNFRSRPGILDYANGLCAEAFPESGLIYEPLVPQLPANPEFDPVVKLEVSDPEGLARWIRAEEARGVSLSDMALLVRRIRGNEKWLKALSSAGIPIAVGSGGLFWEDPRVRELVAFLRWWEDPSNSLSAAIFLRAPWVGVPDAEIDAWIRRDPTLLTPFFESGHPLARVLAPLRGRNLRVGELLSVLLISPEVEAELGVAFLGLWHRAEELSMRGMDFRELVGELTRARDEKRRERDVPPPKNQGQLSVLTLHSAKGLEFRHVILIDLAGKRRAASAPLLFWDRKEGAFLAPRDSDGERDPKDPLEIKWRADEKFKSLAESKRLFYVALTRAQERLVLVEVADPAPKKPKKDADESPYAADDWRAWVENGPVPTRIFSVEEIAKLDPGRGARVAAAASAAVAQAPAARFRRPRHSVTEWNSLSICPRKYEWTFIRPKVTQPKEARSGATEPAAPAEGLTRRELGSRVHACLERNDEEGLRALEAEAGDGRLNADAVIEWARNSEWMAPSSPEQQVWSELPFEVKIGREVLVGAIDRLVLTRQGVAVIDFKVTDKPKTPEAWRESYQTQLELYVEAVRALLRGSSYEALPCEAWIVNISPAGVEKIEIPLDDSEALSRKLAAFAESAADIVAGGEGRPRPGPFCRICEFRELCPEAQS
ncbi:MAG: ATP-dependent DNA helicase [Oligoflexia bacterium]|nr:ATP-dependent DNA helicase [Oligoflexia bacterium]